MSSSVTSTAASVDVSNNAIVSESSVAVSVSSVVQSELVVPPPPLSRSITVKPPKDLALVLSVCGEALKVYGQTNVSAVNILIVVKHIISAVNTVAKDHVLANKKVLVSDCVHWLIDNQKNLSDDEKNTLDLLADTVLPQSIEMMEEIVSCFSCFAKPQAK